MRSDRYKEEEKVIEDKQEEKQAANKKSKKKYIFIFLFLIILLFGYSRFICPNIIEVKEYKIENSLLDENFNGFKIVHISDIHYGTNINEKKLKDIVKRINDLKPDIVIFTGDLIDKDISINENSINVIKDALKDISTTHYKYAISGNEDNEIYYDILDDADFILLDNKEELLFNNSQTPIVIAGFTENNYDILDNEDYNDLFKIALVHKPDDAANITNANLILSGHSLGGIINIVNPLFRFKGATKYYKEHYSFDERDLFISYGLGTNKLNIRFNNNPSINLYRLYKN